MEVVKVVNPLEVSPKDRFYEECLVIVFWGFPILVLCFDLVLISLALVAVEQKVSKLVLFPLALVPFCHFLEYWGLV